MQISPTDKIQYSHYPKLVVYQAVYYNLRYALSYRDIEEIMLDRGAAVDHSHLKRAIQNNVIPTNITIDSYKANKAAITLVNKHLKLIGTPNNCSLRLLY
jgi:transposase-like protein